MKPFLSINSYDCVLLDLDGTIYHNTAALPGAIELIKHLQHIRKPFAFVSNSTINPRQIAARLSSMGATVETDLIHTASSASCDYVVERFAGPALPRYFNLANDAIDELMTGRAIATQTEHEPCDAILVASPSSEFCTLKRQTIALRLLMRGALLVGICADRVYPSFEGLEMGAGAATAMLAYAANVEPVYCGKPQRVFFDHILSQLNVDPARCVMVGDNLDADIAPANAMGMTSVLTLTGVVALDLAERQEPSHRPAHIIKDLSELLP